jgi:hypothetical protein
MAQTCTKCSRANPPDAIYCYFDGFVLGGHSRNGGPVAIGAQVFNNPFVFPTGRTCRSFDELALACQEEWANARDLLHQGYLENFFGGLGRSDLALAAREAARFPDRDRGLDQLLTKLPSDVLDAPKLKLDRHDFNLGVLPVGSDRNFVLRLDNQGMRLLYGSVTCAGNNVWLSLGDGPATAEKHFQFTHELALPVRVRGDRLRASNKPVEARLLVESNGGTVEVVVRAEVPVKPFPAGVFQGARSPRQVAEKAKANPKEAALLFEKGEVAAWYKANGWTYPVQGPVSSGIAAVQQFFEALGLTQPPKVQISEKSIVLQGNVGEPLRYSLEVKSDEKRPVYAHATSNQPWLEVSRAKLNGNVAKLSLAVPAVPDRPGETLTARVVVQSNGNQRFVVPVTLEVGGGFNFASPAKSSRIEEVLPVVEEVDEVVEVVEPAAIQSASPLADMVAEAPSARRSGRRRSQPVWLHVLPALLLGLSVFCVVLVDLIRERPASSDGDGSGPVEPPKSQQGWVYNVKDKEPRLAIQTNDTMRFGLVMKGVPDPRPEYRDKFKRLTFEEDGASNNTIVMIANHEYYFGTDTPDSVWVRKQRKAEIPDRIGWVSTMNFTTHKIQVSQHIEIVPGDTGLLDTCLVYYTIKNYGDIPQKVGLRVMLDTYIGANDGVPFLIPGEKEFVTTMRDFKQKEIPDYIEAIEKPDTPNDLGTVARMGLKGIKLPGIELEDIERLLITRWPGNRQQRWEVPLESMTDEKGNRDSCVALYWDYTDMRPKQERRMAFTYGLSKLDIGEGDTKQALALSVPASVLPNREFVATAYAWNARKGDTVKLVLPRGLTLVDGETLDKTVEEGGKRVQVFWRLKAGGTGEYKLEATNGDVKAKPRTVAVKSSSIFG